MRLEAPPAPPLTLCPRRRRRAAASDASTTTGTATTIDSTTAPLVARCSTLMRPTQGSVAEWAQRRSIPARPTHSRPLRSRRAPGCMESPACILVHRQTLTSLLSLCSTSSSFPRRRRLLLHLVVVVVFFISSTSHRLAFPPSLLRSVPHLPLPPSLPLSRHGSVQCAPKERRATKTFLSPPATTPWIRFCTTHRVCLLSLLASSHPRHQLPLVVTPPAPPPSRSLILRLLPLLLARLVHPALF